MTTMASVLYDAVVVGGGTEAAGTLGSDGYPCRYAPNR
jgi:hypothetical protein